MISQLLDSVIFTIIAFWGLLPQSEFIQILITTYVLKWIVAAVDTPFLYFAKIMFHKNWINEDVLDN